MVVIFQSRDGGMRSVACTATPSVILFPSGIHTGEEICWSGGLIIRASISSNVTALQWSVCPIEVIQDLTNAL